MIKLVEVDHRSIIDQAQLYNLLAERTPEQSISHRKMPTWEEHRSFVESKPYMMWALILNDDGDTVGSIYLTYQFEIGIFIYQMFQGQGYAKAAILEIMDLYPGELLANINPNNTASLALFAKLGFKQIQVTYRYERTDDSG